MELLPHAGKAEISWRVHFESPVECAAQCLVRREGVEHGVLLVISIHEFTPGVPGKRLVVSRLASQGCEDGAAQAVVVGIMLVAARTAVLVLLDAEGVGEDRRAIAVGEAAQHALAVGIVEVLLLVATVGVPLRQVVQDVVGERAGGAAEGAAGTAESSFLIRDERWVSSVRLYRLTYSHHTVLPHTASVLLSRLGHPASLLDQFHKLVDPLV